MSIIPIISDEQWHQIRAKHIGASEVGALANISPWATAYSVFHVKKGNAPEPPVSDDVENGRDFEEAIALRYAAANNLEIVKVREYHECDLEPFLGATLDYRLQSYEGKPIALEIKHVRTQSWRHHQWSPEDDYMPPHIEMQIVAQMMATGWDEGRVVAFCDGEYYSFTRRMSEDRTIKMVGQIMGLVLDMRTRLAENREPDAFGKSVDLSIMGIVAPSDKSKPVVDLTGNKVADELLHYLSQAQDQKRMGEKAIEEAKAKITQLLERSSNEASVAVEMLTEHYTLKRTVSDIAERTQTVKAHKKVLFTVKERTDKPEVSEPTNPIMAG